MFFDVECEGVRLLLLSIRKLVDESKKDLSNPVCNRPWFSGVNTICNDTPLRRGERTAVLHRDVTWRYSMMPNIHQPQAGC